MPKSQVIDPSVVRQASTIKIKDIPVNQYKSDIKKERQQYGDNRLKDALYDMMLIREFETMLNSIKTQGAYEGIAYDHPGPAHLSIGQESSSVGQCMNLTIDDFIFGSHRSHGEILAKCMSTIHQEKDSTLQAIMKDYMGGACLKVVEKDHKGDGKDLAEDFILYGTLAEVFARANGFNRGLGGSMHAFFIPFGSMPNNAIVGGSADICVGAGLFKRINRKKGIVIGNIGDASMGCGPVWEAMMLASMDQYHQLWDKEIGGAPPVMINVFNNFYGMGGQTYGETMGYGVLARIGAGVNADNMHAERVDGYNPLAVADATARKKELLLAGKGPVLMDTITYRMSGHSPSDASSYRSKEEMAMWEAQDCVAGYQQYLIKGGVITQAEVEAFKARVVSKICKALKLAISLEISPRIEASYIESVMFSNKKIQAHDAERKPDVLMAKADNPRVQQLAKKERYAFDAEGKPFPKTKIYAYRDGVFEAMLDGFYRDPTMVAYGEENRDWGGAFACYRGLTEALPYHRLFNSPISEAAIVGSGVGYALCGGRAVVELMYCDFMGRAGDELFNQMSKWQSMSAGVLKMPLVVRVSVGSKYGAQHSQDWTTLVAHIPGLKVMFPVTPYDVKGMLNQALTGTDPVIFFESQRLYDMGETFVKTGVPEGYYETPEGEPAIRREGKDLTIVTLGATLFRAIDAAEVLQSKYGISAEVIDLRYINPLKYDVLVASLKKTGKMVMSSDACDRGSFMHTIASHLTQIAFDELDAPIAVVGSRNWITPAYELESDFFPQKEWILDTIHERILPLAGHVCVTNQTSGEMLRRNKLGV
jgi:2-oxoisovalerate dehydrogenase E1 component